MVKCGSHPTDNCRTALRTELPQKSIPLKSPKLGRSTFKLGRFTFNG